MNSLERVLATVGGQPKDRPALVLNLSLYGSKLTGTPLQSHYTDAKAYAEGQMAVREVFGPDLLLSPFLVPALGEAFGSEANSPRDQAPNIRRFAAASAADALRIPLPDVDSHPRLVYLRDSVRILAARYRGEVPVVGVLASPIDIPPLVIGVEAWLEALLSEPDTARALLDRWTPLFLDLANAMLGDGATLIAATAIPARVCVCITTRFSADRVMWIAECMMKPAKFTGFSPPAMTLPSTSIFTRLEAVTSS